MDKNVLYPILSIVLVILLAGAIYYLADVFGGTGTHEGEHHGEEGEEHGEEGQEAPPEEIEALFFGSMEKPLQHDTYTYAYEETASNGYTNTVFLTAGDNYSYVKKRDAIFTRELFISGEEKILCLETVNRRVCTNVGQNSTFNPYTYTLSSLLFDEDKINANMEKNEMFIEYGAITFDPHIQEKTYDGRNCTEIRYTLDYSKLTLEQLHSVGIDPESPQVLLSKEYNFTVCVKPDNYDVVRRSLDYLNFGEPASTVSVTTQIAWDEPTQVEFPGELDEEMEMEDFYFMLKKSQEHYAECLVSDDFDSCIRAEAIWSQNERLCELISNQTIKDTCYLNVALEKGTPGLCTEVSPELLSTCYMEFAWKYMDTTYCMQIEDQDEMQECIDLVTQANQTAANQTAEEGEETEEEEQPPEEETECQSDSDCVVAGCSSQLCVPVSMADVVTTCEYLPEYDCLQYTTCGCHDDVCGWEENQEYLNCMEEKG